MSREFDFPESKLPELAPLKESFTVDKSEEELKALFLDVFGQTLAAPLFDLNVTGMAVCGSFDLVRRFINTDGLVLPRGDGEEVNTRHIFRAWNARELQGRGLQFLKTYLQVLFPNQIAVRQQWQVKDRPYPTALFTEDDWLIRPIDPETMFLTSRIQIAIDLTIANKILTTFIPVIRSVVPARFVPTIQYNLTADIGPLTYELLHHLLMEKESEAQYPGMSIDIGPFDLETEFVLPYVHFIPDETEWHIRADDDPPTYELTTFTMDDELEIGHSIYHEITFTEPRYISDLEKDRWHLIADDDPHPYLMNAREIEIEIGRTVFLEAEWNRPRYITDDPALVWPLAADADSRGVYIMDAPRVDMEIEVS